MRKIRKGEQLLTDYGSSFWKVRKDMGDDVPSDIGMEQHHSECALCKKGGGTLVLCNTCDKAFHRQCLGSEQIFDEYECRFCRGTSEPSGELATDVYPEENHDGECYACRNGGVLVLCDNCPKCFCTDCLVDPPGDDDPFKCPVCSGDERPLTLALDLAQAEFVTGKKVEALWEGQWWAAEVIKVEGALCTISYIGWVAQYNTKLDLAKRSEREKLRKPRLLWGDH